MKLTSSLVRVDDIGIEDRNTMLQLMDECFMNIRKATFDADLEQKDWVILVRTIATGQLVGFSTQVLLNVNIDGCPVRVLYSGDTVIERQHWGDPALAHAWGHLALRLIEDCETKPLYWFLTSKGFRTYRYLPLFFRTYYPKPDSHLPDCVRLIIDAIGHQISPQHYNTETQIIRATQSKDFVRPGVSDLTNQLQSNPSVQFFVERNPNYLYGDELCCLAALTKENFTKAAYRVINSRPEPSSMV